MKTNRCLLSSLLKTSIVGALLLLTLPQNVLAVALNLSLDANGWTIFTPSSDSRIMYISAEGNDSTGAVYGASSFTDPFNPSSPNAFATYSAAHTHARNGYPDWILFKRGETFYQAIGQLDISGRSSNEPFLIGAYGSTGLSPTLKIGASDGIDVGYTNSAHVNAQYIALQGLRFYANTRDPNNTAEYIGSAGGNGIIIFTMNSFNSAENILIEGCACLYCCAEIFATGSSPWVQNVDFRRNYIYGNYSSDGVSHAQGMWISHINNVLIEENILDHNGWLVQSYNGTANNGQATIFNHNVYSCGVTNTTYQNNIFMRASSIGTKFTAEDAASYLAAGYNSTDVKLTGLIIDNNLYLDNEIGISLSGNYPANIGAAVSPIVRNNVFYNLGKSAPTNRNLSWGICLMSLLGGNINNNLFLNNLSLPNVYGFSIQYDCKNPNIFGNVGVYGMSLDQAFIDIDSVSSFSGISFYSNYIEKTEPMKIMVSNEGMSASGYTFSNDQYYSSSTPSFSMDNVSYTPSTWTSKFEPTATFGQRIFPDKTRTVESYMTYIGGTNTLAAFEAACALQDRYNWNTSLTANAVNFWLRNGFGLSNNSTTTTTTTTTTIQPIMPTGLRIKSN